MHGMDNTIMELHGMLKNVEENMAKHKTSSYSSNPVLAIKKGGVKKKKRSGSKSKGKVIAAPIPKGKDKESSTLKVKLEDATCYHCGEKGHMRNSYRKYLEELKKLKAKGLGLQGSKGKQKVEVGRAVIDHEQQGSCCYGENWKLRADFSIWLFYFIIELLLFAFHS